jgi:hypothetical protein
MGWADALRLFSAAVDNPRTSRFVTARTKLVFKTSSKPEISLLPSRSHSLKFNQFVATALPLLLELEKFFLSPNILQKYAFGSTKQ